MSRANKSLNLIRPDKFCTGVGEDTFKVLAFPIAPDIPEGRRIRQPKVMQQGPVAVMQYTDMGIVRCGVVAPDGNVATNIPGLKAQATGGMARMCTRMKLGAPLDDALVYIVPITCSRVPKPGNANEYRAMVYRPSVGWTWCYKASNVRSMTEPLLRELLCQKFGIPESRMWEYTELTAADREQFGDLIRAVDSLHPVTYDGLPANMPSLSSYLGIGHMWVRPDGCESSRSVTPEDMVSAGLLDSVDDIVIVYSTDYGWHGMEKPYNLRLIPLEAVPVARLREGYLPARAAKLEPGVTAGMLLDRAAEAGVTWDDADPVLGWAQVAYVKITHKEK